jgi:deoxyribonuclease V
VKEIPWPAEIKSAKTIQEVLRKKVRIRPLKRIPDYIAGVDASFSGDMVYAAISLFEYQDMRHIEDAIAIFKTAFPYIPGYLSFREGPAILRAFKKLSKKPELILFDGHGIAHPRRIGIASHIGVLLNLPTIGCAKSMLVGQYEEPLQQKGNWTYLYHNGERVGAVLRTRDGVKPIFVSPEHLIDIESSVDIVMHTVTRFRIPEPLRKADHISRYFRIL